MDKKVRLINANTLHLELTRYLGEFKIPPEIEVKHFRNMIDRLPTIEPQSVNHGRWEKNIRGDYSLVCSECGYGLPLTARDEVVMAYTDCNRQSEEFETASCIQDLANYCPYCGAKMDGDAKDES